MNKNIAWLMKTTQEANRNPPKRGGSKNGHRNGVKQVPGTARCFYESRKGLRWTTVT